MPSEMTATISWRSWLRAVANVYDLRTYIKLEEALTKRLAKAWRKESADIYAAIANACRKQQWDWARVLVTDLDLLEVGQKNREWITYLLRAIAVFGAGTIAKGKPTFVQAKSFNTLLTHVTANFLQYLEHTGTAQVQAEALQLIAEDESKSLVQKAEHQYGNTQINIDPKSSAALSLEIARARIANADLAGDGKNESGGNHVTVRYGLENDDLDQLRAFFAHQSPFDVDLGEIELFDPSEHSDGATPVVVRCVSLELSNLHDDVDEYADFKASSFKDYKPHCTLAYVKPSKAAKYQHLVVQGSFRVTSVTISHKSGVQETIPFGMAAKFEESEHPRNKVGEFTAKDFSSGKGIAFVNGAWENDDGTKFSKSDAARVAALVIPPAWVKVRLNPDPEGDMQVFGKDAKGRTQYRYSLKHNENAKAEKFARLKAFTEALPNIREGIATGVAQEDPAAMALFVIDQVAIRIGGKEDTGADKKAFGVTTLLRRHIKIDGDTVRFNFPGKSGVVNNKKVTDARLASYLRKRLDQVGNKEAVFGASDDDVRVYLEEHGGEGLHPKDYRTYYGTAVAIQTLAGRRIPKSLKAAKALRKQVAEAVSKFLGNTPAVALKSYIDPAVFKTWGEYAA